MIEIDWWKLFNAFNGAIKQISSLFLFILYFCALCWAVDTQRRSSNKLLTQITSRTNYLHVETTTEVTRLKVKIHTAGITASHLNRDFLISKSFDVSSCVLQRDLRCSINASVINNSNFILDNIAKQWLWSHSKAASLLLIRAIFWLIFCSWRFKGYSSVDSFRTLVKAALKSRHKITLFSSSWAVEVEIPNNCNKYSFILGTRITKKFFETSRRRQRVSRG